MYKSPDSSSSAIYFSENSYSRPSSTSPSFLEAYPLAYKLRQDAGRSFCPEDDTEFCPALVTTPEAKQPVLSTESSPTTPRFAQAPTFGPNRVRKVLDIIDPVTGAKIVRSPR